MILSIGLNCLEASGALRLGMPRTCLLLAKAENFPPRAHVFKLETFAAQQKRFSAAAVRPSRNRLQKSILRQFHVGLAFPSSFEPPRVLSSPRLHVLRGEEGGE